MKASVLKSKYWKYLIWFSPGLIMAGLTAGAIAQSWGVVPLALIGVGVAIALLALILNAKALPGFFQQRSTQAGTNALVATLAILVIVGLVNFLGVRYAQRIDLTENRIFTLAPESVEVVQRFNAPIKVVVFDLAPDPSDRALLDSYQQKNPQFSYEYTDPQANPTLARQFGVSSPGEVYIQQGDDRRLVQVVSPEQRLSERQLSNALYNLLNPIRPKVYVLQGHGERPLEAGEDGIARAIAALNDGNYVAEPLNLAETKAIPEDADVIIVASPQRSLLEFEAKALQDYLKRKSGLMVLLDPVTDPAASTDTGLSNVLNEWGITPSNLVVIDPDGQASGLGPAVPIVTQYGNHPITQKFENGISFYPVAQPLGLDEKAGIEAVSLLVTSDRTQAQKITDGGQLEPVADPAFKGEMTLGAALSRPVDPAEDTPDEEGTEDASPNSESEAEAESGEGETAEDESADSATEEESSDGESEAEADADNPPEEARLVVIGNSSFITDGLFDQQLNGDVFLNSVNWLSQKTDAPPPAIRAKEVTNRRLVLSGQVQAGLIVASVVFLPLLGFGLAAVLWWFRR